MEQEQIRDLARAAKKALGLNNESLARIMNTEPNYLSKSIGKNPIRDVNAEELSGLVDFLKSRGMYDSCVAQTQRKVQNGDDPMMEVVRVEEDGERGYDREHYESRIPGAIPEIDVAAGAGEGIVGEFVQINLNNGGTTVGHKVVAEWKFPDGYLNNQMKVSSRQSVILEVRGDSMDPTVRHGDKVIIDLRVNVFSEDGLYLISDGFRAPQMKRLEYVWKSSPPEVKVTSDNPSHREHQTIPLGDIRIVGRVAGRVTAT